MDQNAKEHCGVATRDSPVQDTKELYGNKLAASDGDIGHVKDLYFDDEIWVIRYLVADTGSWLTGRLVLLSPHAFGKLDQHEKTLHVNLRKMQIQDSPSIESHEPVSRQYETEYYGYYGWPTYWEGDSMWGLGGYPAALPPTKAEVEVRRQYHHRDDKHLRSTQAVTGYKIEATDGTVGHVTGFLVDERSWEIRELVVEAGHWYAGQRILISPSRVKRISYEGGEKDVKSVRDGVELVLRLFKSKLERYSVTPIEAKGQPFDPRVHEAISQAPSSEATPGTVLHEVQKGYRAGERLLRPATVVVASAPSVRPSDASPPDQERSADGRGVGGGVDIDTTGDEPTPAAETEDVDLMSDAFEKSRCKERIATRKPDWNQP